MSTRILGSEHSRRVRPVTWMYAVPTPDQASGSGLPVDAEAIRSRAFQEGLAEGRRSVEAQAQATVQPLMQKLGATISGLINLRPSLRKQAEAELVELAFAIAKRILRRELTLDPTAIQGLLRAAFDKLQSTEISRISVHPDQLAVIRAWIANAPSTRRVEVQADDRLQPWDILFETENGQLDASIDTQLAEIERGLSDQLRG